MRAKFPRYSRLFFLTALVLMAGVRSVPGGEDVSAVRTWGDTLVVDSRVVSQINRYADEEEKEFGDRYAADLAAGVRRLVFADVVKRLGELRNGRPEPFIEVTYPDPGFARDGGASPLNKAEEKFEKSFVRTELLAFFDTKGVTPEEALRIFTDADFRMGVSSRIKRIWQSSSGMSPDGDSEVSENCVEMGGVRMVLSPIQYCNRIDEYNQRGLSIQHSQTVMNGGDDDYQTVYFKESLKTFVAIPGGLALHYINYSRSVGMGGIKKKIGRGKIEDSQQKAIDELAKAIESHPADAPQ